MYLSVILCFDWTAVSLEVGTIVASFPWLPQSTPTSLFSCPPPLTVLHGHNDLLQLLRITSFCLRLSSLSLILRRYQHKIHVLLHVALVIVVYFPGRNVSVVMTGCRSSYLWLCVSLPVGCSIPHVAQDLYILAE